MPFHSTRLWDNPNAGSFQPSGAIPNLYPTGRKLIGILIRYFADGKFADGKFAKFEFRLLFYF